ncbi:hypothetical protein BDZ89DRAFT_1069414 [Hymenopellis radicata]|nr:hypothetical protein BDZ89DRAFT_1069414 [Hymenopellis radicata]
MTAFEFPPELELKILQIAANDSHRTALALVRVCRRIQTWIDPILYATIVLDEGNSRLLLHAVEAKGDVFIGKHVKNVYIRVQRFDEEDLLFPSGSAIRIEDRRCMRWTLSKCKGVEEVLVRRGDPYSRGSVDVSDIWEVFLSSANHPTHLTTHSNDSPDNDITASSVVSFLANITHLDTKIVPMNWATYLPSLSATVPSLTHLAMCWSGRSWKPATDPSALADFVAQHAGVEVILLLTRNAHTDLDVLQSDAFDIGSLRVVLEYDYSDNEGILFSPPTHYGCSGVSVTSLDDWDESSVSSSNSTRYNRAMKDMYRHSVRWKWAERKVQQQLASGKHDFSEVIEHLEANLYDEWEGAGDFEGIRDSD